MVVTEEVDDRQKRLDAVRNYRNMIMRRQRYPPVILSSVRQQFVGGDAREDAREIEYRRARLSVSIGKQKVAGLEN